MHNQNQKDVTELSSSFLNMLGLCARAGRCHYGETACLKVIRSDQARLILLDSESSGNTKKRFGNACAFRNVPLILYEKSGGDVSRAVGRPAHKIFAVSDEAFANKLIDMVFKGNAVETLGVEL